MKVYGVGTVIQRDKSKPRSRCRVWTLQATVGTDDGKKKIGKMFHGTYTQAKEALAEWIRELEGTQIESDMPFGMWAAEWMERRSMSGAYTKRTLRTDEEKLSVAVEAWGERPICDLKPADVRALYKSAMNGETPSGRKWSAATVCRLHTTLCKCFGDVVKEGLLQRSPVDGVKPPKQEKGSGKAMPPEEMDELLAKLDLTQPGPRAVALALCCGLRRSECCALRWGDIRNGSVHVVRSCEEDGTDKPPKSDAGVRTVPVPPQLLARLESVRESNLERVVAELPHSLTRWWNRNKASLGCEEYRFHDLRHSYATRLAASGVHVRVAMQLCGWSSVEVAMKVYTHVSDDLAIDAVMTAFSTEK